MTQAHDLTLLLDNEHERRRDALDTDGAELVIQRALQAGLDTLEDTGQMPGVITGNALEISALLTGDEQVQQLNRDYRHQDKPTNILSFPQLDHDTPSWPDDAVIPLGDLALAFETVASEAKARDITVSQHVSHLVVHGLFHLVGFDHDHDHSAEAMETLEVRAMQRLGLK
ncbi:MAG: rRNA maturation RNase YbeY, partial [Pseudomonadota bacterium]